MRARTLAISHQPKTLLASLIIMVAARGGSGDNFLPRSSRCGDGTKQGSNATILKARGSLAGGLQPAVEPGEDGLVPEEGVGRLAHEVVLGGEVEEAAGDPPALERGEGGEPLGHGDAVVEPAMDDQRGRLPAVDEADRVPALVGVGV